MLGLALLSKVQALATTFLFTLGIPQLRSAYKTARTTTSLLQMLACRMQQKLRCICVPCKERRNREETLSENIQPKYLKTGTENYCLTMPFSSLPPRLQLSSLTKLYLKRNKVLDLAKNVCKVGWKWWELLIDKEIMSSSSSKIITSAEKNLLRSSVYTIIKA